VTKDNRLVVFHNPTLKEVTNIEDFPEFKSRRVPVFMTPHCKDIFYNDYIIHDFTWEEISRL